ncbi:MAG TPA: CheR family methyltransferase, partial [Polyangiaceae bacterium]|nr:CheR family methyltransferase [Polyangiaceae bacterium]
SELLIGVTSFFRDPDVFSALAETLTHYIEKLEPGAELRVWVAACSTGEEAYSLAIVIHECLKKLNKHPTVQIFATDLDPRAVQTARTGRYPAAIAADVSAERLREYFVPEDSSYRVSKEIREMLVFAPQSLTRDPPFTRIDLLSCRNMLIYLEPELQQKILTLFHYALLPKGLLLLGTSESLGALDDAFSVVDKKHKIFTNRESVRGHRISDLQLDMPTASKFTVQDVGQRSHRTSAPARGLGLLAERVLLASLVPPSVLITERGEIAYIHGRTGRFLEPAAGEPNGNVFDMAREGLRLELAAAIRQAAQKRSHVVRHGLQVRTNGGFEQVSLTVRPLAEPEALAGLLLVTFESKGAIDPAAVSTPTPADPPSGGLTSDRAAQLENELQHVRENLQGTIEELETSNEELKSTNEELQSTNEELQSTNEELETSREEMQSLNEELQTLNAELQDRNEELSQINDDMQNLLNSTDVATVFLDGDLHIKRFTAPAKKVFHLRDSDIGRPLSDMAASLRYEYLIQDAQHVLETLVYTEKEVQTSDGDWRLMRILPYRTAQNVIDGLIITFLSLDRFKQAEAEAAHARSFCQRLAGTMRDGVLVLDATYRVVSTNPAFCQIFGFSAKALLGEPLDALGAGFDGAELRTKLDELASGRAFPRLRVRGTFAQRQRDVGVTGFDLAHAADGGRFVLLFENFAAQPYPEAVEVGS